MKDENKTREQLLGELAELRRQVAAHEQAEEALRESEEKYRDLFENANDLIQSVDREGKFVYVNRKWLEVLGYNKDEVKNLQLGDVLREDQIPHCMEIFEVVSSGTAVDHVEAVFISKEGREIPVEGNANAQFEKGEFVATRGIFRDATRRKQVESKLEESEERYRRIVENVHDVVYSTYPDGTLYFISPNVRSLTGFEPEEVIGRNLLEFVHPYDREQVMADYEKTMTTGAEFPTAFRLAKKDGSYFHVEDLGKVVREGDAIVGLTGVLRDLTERRRMEQELIRLERLRALGEMSAGVSHNLNNILVGVLGFAELIQMSTRESRTRDDIDQVIISALRARDLVRRLHHAVSHSEEDALQPVSLNEVVREAVQTAQPRWKDEPQVRGVRIEVISDLEEVQPIRGTRAEVHNLLLNLLFNAVDAMPEGGTIALRTRAAAEGVRLMVSDTGIGMNQATRQRVFEPFFTTKTDVGTGLGLFTVYGAITRWGGRIEVESTPGQGTTFSLSFPAWTEAEVFSEGEVPAAAPAGSPGRILIVEDDEITSQLLSRLLSAHHEVDVRMDGEEALELFAPDCYDVALIDLGMPGIPGDQVARELRRIDAAMVAVLISGWPLGDDDPRLAAFDFRIQKPFHDLGEIGDIVTRALELRRARVEESGSGEAGLTPG